MNGTDKSDLEAAQQVQVNLLPPSSLRLGSWEVAGRLVAEGECDHLFDYYPVKDGCCVLSSASFWGTGMRAARLMADFHTLQRIHCNGSSNVSEAMKRLNEHVLRSLGKQKMAMFYAKFDSKRQALHYCNAGYSVAPLLIRRDGSLKVLSEGRSPSIAGSVEDLDFNEAQIDLETDDSLLIYSDGIIRALDPFLVLFGHRLEAILQRCAGVAPADVIAAILAAVQSFRDRALLGDLEKLPTMFQMARDPLLLKDVGPCRAEASRLRKHQEIRLDIALLVLGQSSV